LKTRIILVDDHTMVREGLVRLMASRPEWEVIGTFDCGSDAVQFARNHAVDVAIVDFAMPDMNGIDVACSLQEIAPGARVLMLSAYVDPDYVFRALAAGVQGYLGKAAAGTEFIRAVSEVSLGRRYLCPEADSETLRDLIQNQKDAPPLARLSHRERRVIQFAVEGHTISDTARALALSPKTVETYRSRAMRKLGVVGLAGLVKYAIRHGITSSE
jgi:DNA-binding NarL/FixJ family response regulator